MQKGIVISNISNLYNVEIENNKIYSCNARGKFKNNEISPVAGDRVKIEIVDEEKKIGVIEEIEDRVNYVKRPKMANLSQIVLVVSMKLPKPDLELLDKQLAYAEYLNIKPVICLNKIDLVEKNASSDIANTYRKIGYDVILTNAKDGEGISKLKSKLQNQTTAFSGNSGVGKSTLINKLFDKDITDEGQISSKNKRGKNTTTQVNLYKINENSYIADTPGFSTFDIYEIESENLCHYFIEFIPYIQNCEFVGCSHVKEGKCGIKEALKEEKISKERYERYCKIYQDIKQKEERKWQK